jgi:homoserine kinase type II
VRDVRKPPSSAANPERFRTENWGRVNRRRVLHTDKEELAQVLGHYALGELRAARRIDRGFVNDNWLVETERGRYFLKRRQPILGEPKRTNAVRLIRAQHDLVKWLRKAGFPAPVIVPTAGGETLLALNGGLYEIQGFIEGEPYYHNRLAHLEAAAITLGRYHACVEGCAPGALCTLGELYSPADASAALRLVGTRLRAAWPLDRDPGLATATRLLGIRAGELASRFDRHESLPYLVIHGDYYAGNLLYQGDRIVGVVDYDKANWQPRVVELAEALIYFASPRPGQLKHLVYPGTLEWEPFARFLQGYARVVPLDENEVRALPDYIYCIWFSVSLRCTAQRLLKEGIGRSEALAAVQEISALADWASANAGKMIEIAHTTRHKEVL